MGSSVGVLVFGLKSGGFVRRRLKKVETTLSDRLGFAKSDRHYNKNGIFFTWRPTVDF